MEHVSKPIERILENVRARMEAHKDRADMRADSALDPDRPTSQRRRDYLRYEDEAEAAQHAQGKIDALERLKKAREQFPSHNPLDDVPEERRAWWP